jgi:hypothetical protein
MNFAKMAEQYFFAITKAPIRRRAIGVSRRADK